MLKQLKKALHQKSSSSYNDIPLFIEEVPSFLKKLQINHNKLQSRGYIKVASFLLPNNELLAAGNSLTNLVVQASKPIPSSSVISKAKTYLTKKYFEGLYSFQLPLHYFSKSTISKLESAYSIDTANNGQLYDSFPSSSHVNRKPSLIKVLADSIISIEKFDNRYIMIGEYLKGDLHEASDNNVLKNSIEKEAFDNFLKKIQFNEMANLIKEKKIFKVDDTSSPSLKRLVLDIIENFLLFLKIRESQIQIILLVEYIYLNIKDIESLTKLINTEDIPSLRDQNISLLSLPISPTFSVFVNKPIIRPKRHLNRKRALQRSVSVPDVSRPEELNPEVAIPKETLLKLSSSLKDINFYKQLLNTYLDRLLIWDALKETKNDLVESSELSSLTTSRTLRELDEIEEDHINIFSIKKVYSNELIIPKKFISKIIIPYFDYKCPLLTKFISSKVSGNVRKSAKRNFSLFEKSQQVSEDCEQVNSSSMLNLNQTKDYSFDQSKDSNISKKKSIRRSKTEASISFFSQKQISLASLHSRLEVNKSTTSSSSSNSAITCAGSNKISKLFGKREVDLALPVPASKSKSLSLSEDILRKPKFISRAKSSLKSTKMKSFSQIDSTPTKATKNLKIPIAEIAVYKKSLLEQLAEIDSLEKRN